MSRLTSSLFHKPSPFDSPLLIPSPPESHADTITAFPPPNPANLPDLINHGFANTSPESAGTRFRKSSSIPYHSSSLRDNKEKGQRSGKPLIIVIPPPTLVYDHGHFEHTLSNGPFHRLSEGVVMPLFPSMIIQLTAIAREFNFPSVSGLCLYFHHVEDGLTVKPRISDDSWPSIWSYLSDPLGPSERRPLFSGKVEFDIDLRLARWYTSWLSTIHRELSDYHTHPFPSTGPLSTHSHFRGESQVTLPETRSFDIDVAEHLFTQPSEDNRRHVPRKLSLAERFDLVPVRPDVKSSSRSAHPPPDVQSASFQALSTIVQEEEPKTSRDTLDTRVKSWRESALSIPIPSAATGQTSLDPANLPNDMPINNETLPASAELKLEDFTWSISSAGPKSCDSLSSVSEARVPSVHLASRVVGTVCSTPSICTSFGPDSSECISPMSWGRVPSVHIASRMAGSVCTSPSICTSFGPDDGTPFSPFLDAFRIPTPDLAHRLYESMPPTPQTATTWGAPLSYPPTPRCLSPSPSLDLGERSMPADLEMPQPSLLSHNPFGIAIWPHVWPYINKYSPKNALPAVVPHDVGSIDSISNYPYLNIYNPIYPYLEIYPAIPGATTTTFQSTPVPSSNSTFDVNVGFKMPSLYPSFDIYPAVYPFNLQRIYPSISVSTAIISQDALDSIPDSPLEIKVELKISCVYPSFYLYPAVYPFNLEAIYPAIVTQSYLIELLKDHDLPAVSCPTMQDVASQADRSQSSHLRNYPIFDIYPAVYPFFDLYPAIEERTQAPSSSLLSEVDISQPIYLRKYPIFNIYPAVYPFFDLYPAIEERMQVPSCSLVSEVDISQSIHLRKYPILNIYPAVYPSFDLYPAIEERTQAPSCSLVSEVDILQSLHLQKYPIFNIYPAIYPFFGLYPAIEERTQAPSCSLVPEVGISQSIYLRKYPIFNIYPAVYPFFDLYPAIEERAQTSSSSLVSEADISQSIHLRKYPIFNIYPAVYPFFDFYPAIEECTQAPFCSLIPEVDISQSIYLRKYPIFNIYPAVYPFFDLYPAIEERTQAPFSSLVSKVDMSQSNHLRQYPIFNIYPAVYPFFDLYPAIEERKQVQAPGCGFYCELSVNTTIESVYPFFNIYPPVYPHLEIYPVQHATTYQPPLEQDKAVYPHFNIYPIPYAEKWSQEDLEKDPTSSQDFSQPSRLRTTYPFFNLYPALYPHFDLYPAPGGANMLSPQAATPSLLQSGYLLPNTVEPLYPTFNLYTAVYPYFDLYLPLPELEIQAPPKLNKRQAKYSNRLTHSELHATVMIEPARLLGQMEGMKKFGEGHLGLDIYTESSSPSKNRQSPWPLRDRFAGGSRQNVERRTETPVLRRLENTWGADNPRSPDKRNSVVWQRIKAFDSSSGGN